VRRVRLTVAAALTASLFLASCGGDDKDGEDDAGDGPKGVGESAALSSSWPLTGLDVGSDGSAEQEHPVFVVKIDNSSNSSPQKGLGSADLVVEELVEGGSTRLATFFYSEMPKLVGPIRSMRATDIGIVKPVDGQLVTSGAAGQTIDRLNKAGVKFHAEGSTGMFRDSSRVSLYSVMADLTKLADELGQKREAQRPDDYLPWGEEGDLPKGQPAKKLAASFSGGHTTNWTFRGGKYHNDNTHAAEGDEFLADTVLALRVEVGDAGYTDPAGNFVPETKFEGTGQVLIFHKGRVVRGTWAKDGLDGALTLKTKAGNIKIPAGHVWIELVPTSNGGNVSFN
jgi:hypothetical protein